MGIGITYEKFWTMNPRELKVYYKGQKEIQKYETDRMQAEANYYFIAVSVAISNVFRKKGHKPMTFDEAIKPKQMEIPTGDLTEAQKRMYTEKLFTNLKLQMANFEIAKGGKE